MSTEVGKERCLRRVRRGMVCVSGVEYGGSRLLGREGEQVFVEICAPGQAMVIDLSETFICYAGRVSWEGLA